MSIDQRMRIRTNASFDPVVARSRVAHTALRADDSFCNALLATGGSLVFTCRRQNLVGIVSVDPSGGARVSTFALAGPMGVAVKDGALAIGVANGIKIFGELSGADRGAYFPVALIETGALSVHDIAWGEGSGFLFVNTLFSAVCATSTDRHFDLVWLPPFISSAEPKDRCHLNGFALRNGSIAFATALSLGHRSQSWKHEGPDQGVLVDATEGRLMKGQSLPHSPTFHRDRLWYLESGRGRLCRLDEAAWSVEAVATCTGFARGLVLTDQQAFVGISIIKSTSNETERVLRERFGQPVGNASIELVDLESGAISGRCDLPMIEQVSSLTLVDRPGACLLDLDPKEAERTFVFGDRLAPSEQRAVDAGAAATLAGNVAMVETC